MKTSIRVFISAFLFVTGINFVHAQGTCTLTATASPSTICLGSCVSLNASFSPACSGTLNYYWSPSSGLNNPNIANPTACPTSSMQYSVTACCTTNTVPATVCCATAVINVYVAPGPVVTISGPTTICVGQTATLCASGSGGVAYSWNTGATTQCITVSPTSTTTYTATAVNSNGCTYSATHTLTVYPCTGIAENNILNLIHIYPNPFSESAVIHIDDAQLIPSELKIYDLLGKEVKSYSIQNVEEKIYRNNLSAGLYYYRLLQKGQIVGMGKLIVE